MRYQAMTWGPMLAVLAACNGGGNGDGGVDDSGDDAAVDDATGDGEVDDGGSTAAATDDPEVVYWRDVKPIVDARCTACHNAGGVAPFPLTTYDEVAMYAGPIAPAIASGQMPPWPASDDCREYLFDPSLDAAQIETITTWVELGAPEGDPADEGEALPVAAASLPRVDLEIAMAEAHVATPPTGEVDEHRCFLLDWPETADTHVTGYEVVPGNRKVVHHLVATIVAPDDVAALEADDALDAEYGWPCGAGTGMTGGRGPLLGVWVPGQSASLFPEGTGLAIAAGSKLLLNMHYNTVMGDTAPDRTSIAFMIEDTVDKEGESVFVTDPSGVFGDNMLIEAGDPDSVHTLEFGLFGAGVTVYTVGLHMHTLGSYGGLVVQHSDSSQSCALDIPKWDFAWQLGYRLATPLQLAGDDRVVLTCGFDNSAGNQPIIDGVPRTPTDVTWGEDTYDEMCLGYVYVTRN